MQSENLSKIKKRIEALLAKARSTEHEAEAEAFLAKANELLLEYQLDVSDLAGEDDPIVNHEGLKGAESGHPWRWKLYRAVAMLYGCKSIHVQVGLRPNGRTGKQAKMTPSYEQRLVGRESAVITTDLMYPWIVAQVNEHGKRLAPLTGVCVAASTQRVALALVARILRLVVQNQTETPATAAARNALVVRDQVELAFEEHFPSTQLMKSRGSRLFGSAVDAANSIGLHRQTGGKSQLRLA